MVYYLSSTSRKGNVDFDIAHPEKILIQNVHIVSEMVIEELGFANLCRQILNRPIWVFVIIHSNFKFCFSEISS
jgi:hypothetical protein